MNIDQQVAYLMQGTEYGDDALKTAMAVELRERLIEAQNEKRPLRIYCGFDPTKADLHLGHTVTMRKLRQFQELGHDVTFLIGNFTSLIGDPSDKDSLRPQLLAEIVEENAKTYAEQAFRVLDKSRTTIRYNAEWLSGLTFAQLIRLGSNFTVQQFLSREKFKIRWDKGEAVYIHEMFYALMQGYDAFMLKADIQVGGTDQLFNIVTAARKIMTFLGAKPNIGIITAILPGTDGVVKMSKSLGNDIPISTNAEDMYGKVMSIPDFAMGQYAKLVTRWTPDVIEAFEKGVKDGSMHPRDAKMRLAKEIAGCFYNDAEADLAEQAFVRLFQQRDTPVDMPEFTLQPGQTILDVLTGCGLVKSNGEGRRLIEQRGVRLDDQVVSDARTAAQPGVLQVGKRNFLRLARP